jgi:hypothetical protein
MCEFVALAWVCRRIGQHAQKCFFGSSADVDSKCEDLANGGETLSKRAMSTTTKGKTKHRKQTWRCSGTAPLEDTMLMGASVEE